jgi:hypothetical protein
MFFAVLNNSCIFAGEIEGLLTSSVPLLQTNIKRFSYPSAN